MKNRQMRMIVLILVGLVLFMTSVALLMYSKESRLENEMNKVKMVKAVVSTKKIEKGTMIGAQDIKVAQLPEEFISGAPLAPAEVIGRYATVDILENEPIRKEKISMVKPEEEKEITAPKEEPKIVEVEAQNTESNSTLDTVSIPMNVFRNIDTSLKKGDFIDIVSVVEKRDKKSREIDFKTKYIALHVKIDGFVLGSNGLNSYVAKTEEKTLYADHIVLAMNPKNIKNFLMLYYKTLGLNANRVYSDAKHSGHLWMVKCAAKTDEKLQKEKEKMLADYVRKVKRSTKKRRVKKVRPKKKTEETVSISYED